MKILPKITHVESVAESRLFHVEAVNLTFNNGEKRTFERLCRKHEGAVMIVPITDDAHFLLIREYAVGIEQYELTFPKGFIDQGESIEQAANRELKEEVSHGAKQIQWIKTLATSAAYMSSQLNIVLAQDLYPESLPGDEPEPLETVKWPVNDYRNLLRQDDFVSSMSVAALLLVKEELKLD